MNLSVPSSENVLRLELPNGIVALALENPASPSVVLGGYVWAGSLGESRQQAGLASFVAGMLLRGTERRSFRQISEELESVGAQLGFSAGVHTVGFGGKALAEDLGLLLDIADDCLRRPAFPSDELETLRGQIITGLQRRAHDTQAMADLTFDELLYGDHPYGRSVTGYEDTVPNLTRDDLVSYYRTHYSPQGMVVCIAGAVPAAAALEMVQERLGCWEAPGVSPDRGIPPAVSLAERRVRRTPVPGKTQTDLVLGWPGMCRSDPDYMKAMLTNTVLGVFGMMGRLGDSIRDRQGLAYYCYSHLESSPGQGSWTVSAGVDPADVDQVVESICTEVRRLRAELVSADELSDSQAFLTGSMPLRLETNEGVMGALLDIERYGLGLDYLVRYPDLVNAVTVDDLKEMADKYLDPDTYALAIAGPLERTG